LTLPLETYTPLDNIEIEEIVALKLSLVGLKGFENFYPSPISEGMQKHADLARARALDREILFFDEPPPGLDSFSAK
jgi:phospholipid/cholesterol/gamma-HCH transport system ATP-binding protein